MSPTMSLPDLKTRITELSEQLLSLRGYL